MSERWQRQAPWRRRFARRCGKDDVLAGREWQCGAVGALDDGDGGGLLDGLALAGECGLDHKQVARGDDVGICRHHIAGRETDYIAGDELVEGDLDALAVAQGGASVGDQVLEGLGRIAAAGFLDKLMPPDTSSMVPMTMTVEGSRCGSGTASTSM